VEASRIIAEEAQLFKITVSFGSVTSLISLPCYMSHASIPAAVRAARGLPDDLVRISVGIEDVTDLLAGVPSALSADCGCVMLWPASLKSNTACSVTQEQLLVLDAMRILCRLTVPGCTSIY
jgi:cystathionine beta-lyase